MAGCGVESGRRAPLFISQLINKTGDNEIAKAFMRTLPLLLLFPPALSPILLCSFVFLFFLLLLFLLLHPPAPLP